MHRVSALLALALLAGAALAAPGPQNAQVGKGPQDAQSRAAGPQDATAPSGLSALPDLFATKSDALDRTPPPPDQDEGRAQAIDRGGLAGRGGPNAAGTANTFSATIGSRIYSPMGSAIGSRLPGSPY